MLKIGVLISGGGTNLQSIIDKVHGKSGEIAIVVSNKADAYGLVRAQEAGIPTAVVNEPECDGVEDFNRRIIQTLQDNGVELVVLAGFMRIMTKEFIDAYPNKIVNIHPALIPSFCGPGYFGMHVHQAVYDYGAKITGATVHFVNEDADAGPIIAQRTVAVDNNDTPEMIQKKVLVIEHELLPWVVQKCCEGKVTVDGRHVAISE